MRVDTVSIAMLLWDLVRVGANLTCKMVDHTFIALQY